MSPLDLNTVCGKCHKFLRRSDNLYNIFATYGTKCYISYLGFLQFNKNEDKHPLIHGLFIKERYTNKALNF